jgi:transcriptional regulator with XRE-family HTH domain
LGGQKQPKINQAGIAALAGVDRSQVTHWKGGAGNPSLDQVMKIARGLGVSMDYLLQEEQDWLDDAEKMGVGPLMDKDAEALLRMLAALDVSPAEAMRRIVAWDEKPRIVASQKGTYTLPAPSGDPDGDVPVGREPDGPAGEKRRVKRRRTDKDLK